MLDTRIGPNTLRYAVLGEKLGHTWAPSTHNSIFPAAGMDAVYIPVTIPREKLASVVDVFRDCFGGFNVTIPYKERIMPLLDEIDDAARACGAVNTVENRDGRLIGHITDGLGLLRAIEEQGVSTDKKDVLILGGGGAARAAAVAFLQRGGRVTFALRDTAKGEALVGDLAKFLPDGASRLGVVSLCGIEGAHDILVNCTPVGMYPHADASPVSDDVVARCGAVFDAVYNPRETRLIAAAKRLGVPAVEGLGMLYYQAVEAEKIWLGGEPAAKDVLDSVYGDLQAQLT